MACLYKRKENYWISYYIEGRQIQKSLRTSNQKVALAKKRRIEYEGSLGDLNVASQLRVPIVLEAFCKYLEATRTHKSFKNDFSRLRAFFGPICESLKPCPPGIKRGLASRKSGKDKYAHAHVQAELIEDISSQTINRFLADRIKLDSWAPKTVNLMREILHRFFSYAIKHHGFCSRDRRYPTPVACVERMREPAPQIRFLSLEEILEQLEVLMECPVIHAMTATYIYAGLRREEALWLTPNDIDMKARLLRVRAKTIKDESWQPKTKRNRVIPISTDLFEILKMYKPPIRCTWSFPSPTGKRWDPDNFSQDLRKINRAAGLDWSCLDFRHTFGSHLAQKGESLYKIAELMGNSPAICRKHYAALVPEKMTDVVEFSIQNQMKPKDDDTKRMLTDILNKLKGEGEGDHDPPHLRLVRFNDPA